ncbi:MAG: tetratricopeptide repeat protein, partial [Candidatus Hodarchaeota archaeon]
SLGQHPEAIGLYEEVTKHNPNNSSAYLMWGISLAALGDHKTAVKKYSEAAKKGQGDVELWMQWSASLFQLNEYDEVIKKLQKIKTFFLKQGLAKKGDPIVDPIIAKAYFNWGRKLVISGHLKEALEKCKIAAKFDSSENVDYGYKLWGLILSRLGRHSDALAKFKKAEQLGSRDTTTYTYWGQSLLSLNRYKEAIDIYQKAIESDPEYDEAYFRWGVCLLQLQRHEEAIEKYKKAIEIGSTYTGFAYAGWGASLIELNRYTEAIEKCQKAIEINPKMALAYSLWATSLEKLERYEEAVEKQKKTIEIEPDDSSHHGNVGWYYFRLKDFLKSIEASQKALTIDNKAIEIRYNLAIALLHNGQFEEAKREYKTAIQQIIDCKNFDNNFQRKEDILLNGLKNLQDAKKKASGKLLEQIDELINILECAKKKL